MTTTTAPSVLENCHTLVVKLGSSLLVHGVEERFDRGWFETLTKDLVKLRMRGTNVVVVSSGAVALGCLQMGFVRSELKLAQIQAAAAIGQIALAHEFRDTLRQYDVTTAQVLLTLEDTEQRKRYLNARNTLESLLDMGIIPVVNENDTVATSEIRVGDNDRLAARVAQMISADCLLMLSDTEGLFTADPRANPDATFLSCVRDITPDIEAMAGTPGSRFGTGGMMTKISAAKVAVASGCHMILASGAFEHPVERVLEGARCTHFVSSASPIAKRKQWIAGSLKAQGRLHVDDGAVSALRGGSSLLPVGVVSADGQFERGDAVLVVDSQGRELARGLAGYPVGEVQRICGLQSNAIEATLGYPGPDEIIHRDDLTLHDQNR